MSTYTKHKLTTHALTRLSAIVHQRKHKFGVSLQSLEHKGLVKRKPESERAGLVYGKDCFYDATPEGQDALKQARAEGW